MTKIIRYGFIATLVLGSLSACDKEFLETAPTNQVATGDAFSTTNNAWAALNGVHRILYSQIFGRQAQGGQSGNMMYMDVLGEDVVFSSSANSWFRDDYRWIAHRLSTSDITKYNYLFYYVVIGNVNMILANIDGAEGPEADKAAIKGQSLVYRAWSYFQMVQLYGKRYVAGGDNSGLGVPLVLEPTTAITPRATVEAVYAQINTDLDEAMGLLQGYSRANKSHFDLNVAKGIKARVALAQQNWPIAAQMAREAREGYTLMSHTDYLSGFNNYNNQEWMWASHIQSDQTNYFYSFFAYMSNNYNSTAIRTNPRLIFSVLYDQIADTDIRKQLWDPTGENVEEFPTPPNGSRYPYYSRKFSVADPGMSIGDVPYMRGAEMILVEAEALARNGQDADAAEVLFELASNRDPEYTLSINRGQALVDEIMFQRRAELWGEGFRFYDLKRTNSPLDRNGGNHNGSYTNGVFDVPAGDIRWEFLIPQDEINNTNGVVVQNPQ
ncbi:RagB/SusD family nutrient uptake outer membrane protein [Parapedobacter sp. ISTM3]|uniref:RagB/SusD family nutrient uptake outer membrane protein n=1 Tax=Parapedobacter sp. ISTM3 TaxID=2800130 RepID=UPI0019086B2A|nr:RagB/SusD family nutrient uptake outer membrane protein [Parapedobacter sp. ISTM3]MBK1440846.1 RagB/SusD family nutrient uptake outer membrane protein [Parapedobacter sp. ISTM3]